MVAEQIAKICWGKFFCKVFGKVSGKASRNTCGMVVLGKGVVEMIVERLREGWVG